MNAKRALFLLVITSVHANAEEFPAPSGRFTFEGKAYIGTATLTNATIRDKALYFDGKYRVPAATFWPRAFRYQQFTVVTKLQPGNFTNEIALLVGGTAHRWLALKADYRGQVKLSLNNSDFRQVIERVKVKKGEWITLAVSFDLQTLKIVVYANGVRVSQILLPQGFVLAVVNDAKWRDSDKVWTFTDFSSGDTFQGLVAGLLTFDTVLSDDQVMRISPQKN
jgi:hypothetical protein